MFIEDTIISTYLDVCEHHKLLSDHAIRCSPNQNPTFTDEEVITIYFIGKQQGLTRITDIYRYTQQHWLSWFPHLPTYARFMNRLNRLDEYFIAYSGFLAQQRQDAELVEAVLLIDSMPIIMAKGSRSSKAKIAPELADKGYCATKKLYYYGIKFHLVGQRIRDTMPKPMAWFIGAASEHDLTAATPVLIGLTDVSIYADKAYQSESLEASLKANNSCLESPVKLKKGQERLDYGQQLYSSAVSSVRQPIESFFSWLQAKTSIQNASTVRSESGLKRHVFANLCFAFYLFIVNP